MRYWVWVHYQIGRSEEVEQRLRPWRQWGSCTGSGSDFRTMDISWEMRDRDRALERARSLHSKLNGIPHKVEVIDTRLPYRAGANRLLALGRMPRSIRRR